MWIRELIALGKLQSHPYSTVSWSIPTLSLNKIKHTPIQTPLNCDSHNKPPNPVLYPPTCDRYKTSTVEKVKLLINYPMTSHLHQTEGNSKQLTQLMIPTVRTLLQPVGKILSSYSEKVCPVYCMHPKMDSTKHHKATQQSSPRIRKKQPLPLSDKKHQKELNMDLIQLLNERGSATRYHQT